MHVVLVSNGPIPCFGYGGRERIVQWHASELARRGHRVTVIADKTGPLSGVEMIQARNRDEVRQAIPDSADIVNFHGMFYPNHAEELHKPFLNTPHNLIRSLDISNANWNFLSDFHAQFQGGTTVVRNGLPPEDYQVAKQGNGRLLFFSGFSRPGKNLTRAIDLTKRFDLKMDIAGGHRWSLLTRSVVRKEGAFFRTLGPRFKFHGIVGGERKKRMFADARALIFPIRVPEPGATVVVEALMSGTPVLGTPLAVVPELVKEGDGFLFETDQQFAEALEAIDGLDRQAIRERAIARFSVQQMTDGYLNLYERILDGERIG